MAPISTSHTQGVISGSDQVTWLHNNFTTANLLPSPHPHPYYTNYTSFRPAIAARQAHHSSAGAISGAQHQSSHQSSHPHLHHQILPRLRTNSLRGIGVGIEQQRERERSQSLDVRPLSSSLSLAAGSQSQETPGSTYQNAGLGGQLQQDCAAAFAGHSIDNNDTGYHSLSPSPLRLATSTSQDSAISSLSSSQSSLLSSTSAPTSSLPSSIGGSFYAAVGGAGIGCATDHHQHSPYRQIANDSLLTDSPENLAAQSAIDTLDSTRSSLYSTQNHPKKHGACTLPPLRQSSRATPARQPSFVELGTSSSMPSSLLSSSHLHDNNNGNLDNFGLPPIVNPQVFAPIQLDSSRVRELDLEEESALHQPWDHHQSQGYPSAAGLGGNTRKRRASFTAGVSVSAEELGYSHRFAAGGGSGLGLDTLTGGISSLEEHEHCIRLSRSDPRSRSRSPPLRRPSLAQSQHHSSSSNTTASSASAIHQQQQHHHHLQLQQHQQQQKQIRYSPPEMPKHKFVEGLVGAACIAIEVVWRVTDANGSIIIAQRSPLPSTLDPDGPVLPLRHFIKEVLRRSRSTCSTLQTALYYIHKSRETIRDRVRECEEAKKQLARIKATGQVDAAHWNGYTLPSPPYGTHDVALNAADAIQVSPELMASLIRKVKDPVLCGRRMFLAALICASKFLQDRTYSNRAWAKISSLPITEINANEKAFLQMMDYNLYVDSNLFRNWTRRLQDLSEKQSRKVAAARDGLDRSHSEYLPAPETMDQIKASSPVGMGTRLTHTPTGTPRGVPLLASPARLGASLPLSATSRPPMWASASMSAANLHVRSRTNSSSSLNSLPGALGASGASRFDPSLVSSMLPRPTIPPARMTYSGTALPLHLTGHGAQFRRLGSLPVSGGAHSLLHQQVYGGGSCSDLARMAGGDEGWHAGAGLPDNMVVL